VVSARSPRVAWGGLAALVLLTAACSATSSGPVGRVRDPGETTLRVKVRDFKIVAPEVIAAGTVALDVRNDGPDTHELLLVRSDGAPLPLRADDLTVDEDAVAPRTVSELDDDRPGSERTWAVALKPGSYEIFCNMSGHYEGGMHTRLLVR
jgi:hypothetical protein